MPTTATDDTNNSGLKVDGSTVIIVVSSILGVIILVLLTLKAISVSSQGFPNDQSAPPSAFPMEKEFAFQSFI